MTERKDSRINIALKLYPDKDADLIKWLEGLERGNRLAPGSGVQGLIKAALRKAVFGVTLPDERDETIATQRAQIEEQRAELDELRALRQDHEELKRFTDELSQWTKQWIDYQQAQLEGRVNVTPVGIPPQAQIEEVQTIDEDTERRRQQRLKKAKW